MAKHLIDPHRVRPLAAGVTVPRLLRPIFGRT